MDPSSPYRQHISYNRLALPLVSDRPLLYRTHYQWEELKKVPSEYNTLIFLTRNPKELIYRQHFLRETGAEDPEEEFIHLFLMKYLASFEVYDTWCETHRKIVFYEDFIAEDEKILLELLSFIEEPPLFLEDFLQNKQEYLSRLLQSYASQHTHNLGGSSSLEGPKPIHYTKNASPQVLNYIDVTIQGMAPAIWDKYLKRYQSSDHPL